MELNNELGKLLIYVARVATAIRMNSPYNGEYTSKDPREVGIDVLWLSDSLHCLDRLGNAIQSGNKELIINASTEMIDYYGMFTEGFTSPRAPSPRMGDPKEAIDRWGHLFDPREAIALFTQIRNKAQSV